MDSISASALPSSADLSYARTEGSAERQRSALEALAKSGDKASVRKAAEKFESQFLSQMLGLMFKGVKTDGMFGGGNAEGMWRDFYVEQVGDVITKRGGIGVANTIERELLKLQEATR